MNEIPKELKLTLHAQTRLKERHQDVNYDMSNIMNGTHKWYSTEDLIPNSKLYIHAQYVCRRARQKLAYLTDGNIELLYDKGAGVVITVMEVKEKFQPVTQFIKPELLKKENSEMRRKVESHPIGTCPDCGTENVGINIHGRCENCHVRMINATRRGKEYIPYVNLSEDGKRRVDVYKEAQRRRNESKIAIEVETAVPKIQTSENYYQTKASKGKGDPIKVAPIVTPAQVNVADPLSDPDSLIQTLRSYGSEIPEENLRDVLDVLISTDKLRDIFMTIAGNDNQQAMLDLDQTLNVVERKLQHDWEYNGFRAEDDAKFKSFLTWRRTLKGAIFFWRKIYSSNVLLELQKAWETYIADPTEKTVLAGERLSSALKRYQITTDSISTIFNTRKPFTRVFYAMSEEDAYKMFVKWMADRQLHEDKSKTTIVELKSDGKDVREKED